MNAKRWAISKLSRLASEGATAAIVGIGSAVRPVHHPGSDVDFLVVSDIDLRPDESQPIDVDLCIFRTTDIDQRLQAFDDLLGWALRFGRPIFDRNQYWANLCTRWADKIPFPSPEVSIARALHFERFARELVSMQDLDAALEQVVAMLTHRSRAKLLRSRTYPASRPELPAQLREIGEYRLAEWLESALLNREIAQDLLDKLKERAKAA
ncbi:nucleotidyltransferase domain-containing protein [Candidatus Binatus sp.]|uniref:nucleotidyltransferase domain-containing protein n=1 Tax=Candidatus Binatus sp. TaxID=2811406 RepID=UPI003C75DA7A